MTKLKRKLMPAILFYTGDWLKDPAVRCMSLAARGLWIDMLCLMYESPTRGYLSLIDEKPVTAVQLARMVGGAIDEVETLLSEMSACGTYSVTAEGVMYSRRMVSDEELRELKSKAGKASGRARQSANTIATEGQQKGNTTPTPLESESETASDIEKYINFNSIIHSSPHKYVADRKARQIQPDDEIVIVYESIPPNRIESPRATKEAIVIAIDRICASASCDFTRIDCAIALGLMVGKYYESPSGQPPYFVPPPRWFNDEYFLADPSSWDARKKTGTTGWDAIPQTKGTK